MAGNLMQVSSSDCSLCPVDTFLSSPCTPYKDRVCTTCSSCDEGWYELKECTPLQDTSCYPCTECKGGEYISTACTTDSNRVCSACTLCTSDEYESTPCAHGADRVCRSCESCTLTKEQEELCKGSKKWRRLQMKAPYGCPAENQEFKTLEDRLQRAKSNLCGAGRCSCTPSGVGNMNPDGEGFPNDERCTGPKEYNIDL